MGWKKTVARLKEKIPSLRQTIVSFRERKGFEEKHTSC